MSTSDNAVRRSGRRIGVKQGANFDERREIILREAARAFTENGVQNTSIDDVAGRLGVTKPALYHYVSSKDEMIRQCLEISVKDSRVMLEDANRIDGTGMDKLRFVFEHWGTNAATDFGRAIVLIEPTSLSEASRKRHQHGHRMILHGIEALIEEGIKDGSIRKCNPTVTTLALMGMFNSPARWFRRKGALSIDEAITELIGLMEKGIAPDDSVV